MQPFQIKNNLLPILIIGSLFFIFGFVTWLNGILIPYLKLACELTDFQASFVAFMFYISYTIMALPSAWLLKKTGFKSGMMYGLIIMALGTLLFIPAALTRQFEIFLAGLFVMGSGLALLQTAANPYVTILGPIESAARRISIMGICNKLAGAIAPLVLAYFVLQDVDDIVETLEIVNLSERITILNALAMRVIGPYLVMTLVLLLMAIGIKLSPLPTIDIPEETSKNQSEIKKTVFSFPALILGTIALFFYVGVEVIAGDTIIRYGHSIGINLNVAKTFTTATMIAMTVGYVIGIIITPKYVSQAVVLKWSALLGILFSALACFLPGMASVAFIALLGLANAMIWPVIWPLALNGLGRFTSTGSALLIMSISGGAFLTVAWGKLSDTFNAQSAYLILIPAYIFILFYAIRGYRISSWGRKS